MRGFLAVLAATAVGAVLVVMAQGDGSGSAGPSSGPPGGASATDSGPPEIVPYRPLAAEEYPNGKRIAARIAQRALTYEEGASARSVARSLGPSAVGLGAMTRVLEPVVEPDMRSSAEVVYPQFSGLTATSLGAMVVARQELDDGDGDTTEVTRVVDVRLRRSGGPWSLDGIGSFGGSAPSDQGSPDESAQRVLSSPNIELPDPARWDIQRGEVDPDLLDVLARAAADRKLAVTVIDSGHPPNVWQTSRPSAHAAGFAVDIWAVGGVPVIEQRGEGSPAHDLASSFIAGGAEQLGSPWVLGTGGSQSFTDPVHQDHIHLQQSSVE